MTMIWMVRAGAVLSGAAATPALAHHVDGNMLPGTLVSGLLSGLGHPVIGLDHLAFVVAVGVLAAAWPRALLPVAAFLAAALAGCLVHAAGADLPGAELAVALSVLAAGAAVIAGAELSAGAAALLLALAGAFHGYAYGESIVGAEPGPLLAYLLGFTLIQGAIILGVRAAARAALRSPAWPLARRAAGMAVVVIAVLALAA